MNQHFSKAAAKQAKRIHTKCRRIEQARTRRMTIEEAELLRKNQQRYRE